MENFQIHFQVNTDLAQSIPPIQIWVTTNKIFLEIIKEILNECLPDIHLNQIAGIAMFLKLTGQRSGKDTFPETRHYAAGDNDIFHAVAMGFHCINIVVRFRNFGTN